MTTEEMIEVVIEDGVKAYRNHYSKTWVGRQLQRHIPVKLDGIEFSYWREWAIYKTGQYLQELCPTVTIEIELDGNNSTIEVGGTTEEINVVNYRLEELMKQIELLDKKRGAI